MKEDVLEQIVDDYLQMQGYFTTHNVRFNPPKDQHYAPQVESVPSDIDVVGLHPRHTGARRVMVVSCKSWQSGFAAPQILAQLRGEAKNPKRPRELQFRELWMPRWAQGFRKKIEDITGSREFTYCLAVTRLQGDASGWADDATIRECLGGNPLQFLTLKDMWASYSIPLRPRQLPARWGAWRSCLRPQVSPPRRRSRRPPAPSTELLPRRRN
ncbi:MAG TPA: hypothetical protein VMA72_19940 [Streptosporangiaceae bacterium]|nr:hypothetical protein [Streptosporangiaceae bacterium]